MSTRQPIRTGILSTIIASMCCIGPLILVLLGLGSLGLGTAMGKYHWVFLMGGVLLILFSWRTYFREKKRCNSKECRMENKKTTLITLIIATIIILSFMGLNLYTYTCGFANLNVPVAGMETIVIPVEGMTCFTCEITLSSTLKKIDGVVAARASAKNRNIEVVYDSKKDKH